MAKSRTSVEPSRAEQIEREQQMQLVQSAIKKHRAGQPLSRQETTAWKRFERDEDERRGLRFVRSVPKSVYCEWSGRQTKILHDEADLYGLPLRGATIDLPELVRWIHNFLAEHKHELPGLVKTGKLGDGETPSIKDRLLEEKLAHERLKREEREMSLAVSRRQLVPVDAQFLAFERMASILRGAGEQLYKQHGQAAGDVLSAALESVVHIIDELTEEIAGSANTPAGALQSESEPSS